MGLKIKVFLTILLITLLAACMPQANKIEKAACGSGEIFNYINRQCELLSQQAPTPTLDTLYYLEDTGPHTVLLTYSDIDNDLALACQIVSYNSGIDVVPPGPCLCINGICTVLITLNANFYGQTSFSYQISDQDGASPLKQVNIQVTGLNDAPVASDGAFSTNENQVLTNNIPTATDADLFDQLTYSIVSLPQYGILNALNATTGRFIYTPYDDDTTHTAQIDSFTYRVCDNGIPPLCATGTIFITVNPVNNAPTTVASYTFTIDEDSGDYAFTVPAGSDYENDTLSYTALTNPTKGLLSNCFSPATSRDCTYTPNLNQFGSDSFVYRVCDPFGACAANVTVTITINPINDPPVIGADQLNIPLNEDSEINVTLSAVSDVDNLYSELRYEIETGPLNGVLSNCDGMSPAGPLTGATCKYQPNPNHNGPDSFTYRVYDGTDYSTGTATVSFNVIAVNDAPTISLPTSAITVNEGGTYNLLGVLVDEGGDSDEDIQTMQMKVVVSCADSDPNCSGTQWQNILPIANLQVFYGANPIDISSGNYMPIGDGVNSASAQSITMKITPIGGAIGKVKITVYARDSLGLETSGAFTYEIISIGALHGGWRHISAVGAKTDKKGSFVPSTVTTPSIYLEWNDFTVIGRDIPGVGISGYQIFRRITDEDYDYTIPYATTSGKSFTDDQNQSDPPVAGKVYYYLVRPVDSTNGRSVPTQEVFSEVRVIAPPNNMAFVHRWMVNQEVCSMMHLSSQIRASENFKCPYSGPGHTNDYYDIGSDLLVDPVEAGCPYSERSELANCPSYGCVGTKAPTDAPVLVATAANQVYYDRSSGKCYRSTAGLVWQEFDNTAYTSTIANNSIRANLPALVNISQANAYNFCRSRNNISLGGFDAASALEFRLPTRKEQIAYSAWSYSLSDSSIDSTETGLYLNSYSKCNSSAASGLELAYSSAEFPSLPYLYSLPGTATSNIRSVYTGSQALGGMQLTPQCISRYGIQDFVGNVMEWVVDQLECYNADYGGIADRYKCQGIVSLVDGSNDFQADFDGDSNSDDQYWLDGILGPCASTGSTCNSYLDGWFFKDEKYLAGKFIFPMGLPMRYDYDETPVADSLLEIGPTNGITSSKLHNDYFNINALINAFVIPAQNRGVGGIATGGSFNSGNKAGRYSMELIPTSDVAARAAGRTIGYLTYTAITAGSEGNSIVVNYVDDGTVSGDNAIVSVNEKTITVKINTEAFLGTQDDTIKARIEANTSAIALVSVANSYGGGETAASATGDGVIYTAQVSGIDPNDIVIKLVNNETGNDTAKVSTSYWSGGKFYIEVEIVPYTEDPADGTTASEIGTALAAYGVHSAGDLVSAVHDGITGTHAYLSYDSKITFYSVGVGAAQDTTQIEITADLDLDVSMVGTCGTNAVISITYKDDETTSQEVADAIAASPTVSTCIGTVLANGDDVLTNDLVVTNLINGANETVVGVTADPHIVLALGTGYPVQDSLGSYYLTGGADAAYARRNDVGFRCLIRVNSDGYEDANHNYVYD